MWLRFHSKSWLNYNYGLWLRKLVVRWTKQQDKPLRVKFSVVDVPNMVIQIRERFNIFGMLYQKTQPCPYPFHIVTRSNSKQLPKVVSLYVLNNQNTEVRLGNQLTQANDVKAKWHFFQQWMLDTYLEYFKITVIPSICWFPTSFLYLKKR